MIRLTLGTGDEAGKAYELEQAEVKLGRVSANDVVVHHPSVSRRHAIIRSREGQYLIEDLGSSQGTKVNQEPVKSPRALRDGDVMAIGDVTFQVAIEKSTTDPAKTDIVDAKEVGGVPEPDRSEEMVPTAPVQKISLRRGQPAPPSAPRPAIDKTAIDVPAPVFESKGDATAKDVPAISPKAIDPAAPAPSDSPTPINRTAADIQPVPDPEEDEPTMMPPVADQDTVQRPALQVRKSARLQVKAPAPSAADRARRRREAKKSVGGRLLLIWADANIPVKILIVVLLASSAAGGAYGAWLGLRTEKVIRGPEPDRLSALVVSDSFGLGDGVSWERPDMKLFTFTVLSPTRAVVILHYQAKDISDGEVTVSLNGVEVGSVPPDTNEVFEREIEIVLPPEVVKRNAPNQLLFDNVRNPPGKEPWRVFNLWMETLPIPELPEEQLIEQAKEYAKKAKEAYDRKDVGAENLFKAWKGYRNAWATLEGLLKKPELHTIARTQMLALHKELDNLCGRLMLEAKRQMELKKHKRARQTLEDVSRYFPTGEHRCHNLALEKIREYEL